MPKRKRLFTPSKSRIKISSKYDLRPEITPTKKVCNEVDTARGRLKGALLEALDPTVEDSDHSDTPVRNERRKSSVSNKEYLSDEEAKKHIRKSPPKQSYVLKLFDRSVDLSQFEENSPLYPICRAWMTNQPKANYKEIECDGKEEDTLTDTIELPGPEGPHVSRVPDLLPEQKAASKENINLNYREAPPPPRDQLLRSHTARWAAVRQAWLDQAVKVEARYEGTQKILNKINVEYMNAR